MKTGFAVRFTKTKDSNNEDSIKLPKWVREPE